MTTHEMLGKILSAYAFSPIDESHLQEQIALVLADHVGLKIGREVICGRDRYDILIEHDLAARPIDERIGLARVVLELKVKGSAAAVERQAQRYANADDVDEVAVVTTSNRLANELRRVGGNTLGGKPFGVIALRVF